ncbi:MAG: Gfo/Idh/MocA family oxidoreductase [Sedimentisphaerales bacterium]|nr:Gfo/Idh/MocA family oxidoreductase [Sedimentisphaerales bacterium]
MKMRQSYALRFGVLVWIALYASPLLASEKVFRIGMIGLDTSHVIAFTRQINDPKNQYRCKVVAGYPGGSADVEASITRVDKYTAQLRDEMNVQIVDSIEDLCSQVDGVMLESVDGRPHLRQIKPVLAAKLPVFVDKPMAGSLEDVIEIFQLAKEQNVPCWSSSSLRYAIGIQAMKNEDTAGDILGCDVHSPCSQEPHHPDLYWYGVHGVEILYALMGTGCESVSRTHTQGWDVVTGRWKDGRIATYRGIRQGKSGYGATVYGSKAILTLDKYEGYGALVEEVVKFFTSGKSPVPAKETIELFAFMTAADVSKAQDGKAVSITEVIEQANQKIKDTK